MLVLERGINDHRVSKINFPKQIAIEISLERWSKGLSSFHHGIAILAIRA